MKLKRLKKFTNLFWSGRIFETHLRGREATEKAYKHLKVVPHPTKALAFWLVSSPFAFSPGGIKHRGEMNSNQQTHLVKSLAAELGFSYCGISKAEFLENEAPKLEEWLKRGYQGKMSYLENYFDKRLDPVTGAGAKSVISLMYNYYPEKDLASQDNFKIAKYAYGRLPFVVKTNWKRCEKDCRANRSSWGRVFVDSARWWSAHGRNVQDGLDWEKQFVAQ